MKRTTQPPARAIQEPWEWLRHQREGNPTVVRKTLQHLEDAGHTEDRIRHDYTGRYPVELLQNAHDACADAQHTGTVSFTITETALLVANEGVSFDYERVVSLVRLGSSEKLDRKNHRQTIGYKGVGFTAVFEVSERPQIISKDIRFGFDRKRAAREIRKILRSKPSQIPTRYFPFSLEPEDWEPDGEHMKRLISQGAVTVIRLPLKRGVKPEQIAEDIHKSLTPEVLLFMPFVERLVLTDQEETVSWTKRNGRKVGKGHVVNIEDSRGQREAWLISKSHVRVPRRLIKKLDDPLWRDVVEANLAVALPWKYGRGIETREAQNLHVYFPTDDQLGRAILIHGDFYIESSRRRIEYRGVGGEISQLVAKKAAKVAAELAESVSSHGLPLLQSLAKTGHADGFGEQMGELLEDALRRARIARPADGSKPRLACHIELLPDETGDRQKRALARLLQSQFKRGVLHPNDHGEEIGELLTALGANVLSAEDFAAHLNVKASGMNYEAALKVLWHFVRCLNSSWTQEKVVEKLTSLPILKDKDGKWRRPEEAVLRLNQVPDLPLNLKKVEISLPRSRNARQLIKRLGVKELTMGGALDALLAALPDDSPKDVNQAKQVFRFIEQIWVTDKSLLAQKTRKLTRVHVPARTARGTQIRWRRAGTVYFTRLWTGTSTLEELYGSSGQPEFLAETPPRDSRTRRARFDLYRTLGVADTPRTISIHTTNYWNLPRSHEWQWDPNIKKAFECPDGHPNSPNSVTFEILDRLEEILKTPTIRIARALAKALKSLDPKTGAIAQVRCSHSSHKSKNTRKTPGYHQWLIQETPWIPVRNDSTRQEYRRLSETWVDIPKRDKWLLVPQSKLSHDLVGFLGPVSATHPKSKAIEGALRDLCDHYPDLPASEEPVIQTVQWLLKKLDVSLSRSKPERGEDHSVPFPVRSGDNRWAWNNAPLIADLPDLDQIDGLILLPTGDWKGLERAYGLKRASTVLQVAVHAGGTHNKKIFPRERRTELGALLEKKGADSQTTAGRLARLREKPVKSLFLKVNYNGTVSTLSPTFHLSDRRDKRGRTIDGDLYVSEQFHQLNHIPRGLSVRLAHYLGEPELEAEIALLLSSPITALEGISEEDLRQAEAQLRRQRSSDPTDDTSEEDFSTPSETHPTETKNQVLQRIISEIEEPEESTEPAVTPQPVKLESPSPDETLPPIETVKPKLIKSTKGWQPRNRQTRKKQSSSGWPNHPDTQNQSVGKQGEKIAYREEILRVKALGYPESRVVWTSRSNPYADHDIRSVDDDGKDLWIEVKSTKGTDGRFHWSKGEFERALKERDRYVLCRIYEAHTVHPKIRLFRDPVGLYLEDKMRLDLADFYGEVQPL